MSITVKRSERKCKKSEEAIDGPEEAIKPSY